MNELLDEHGCAALLYQYCRLIDSGNAARVVELFVPDGIWTIGGTTVSGRSQLAVAFERRQAATGRTTRHVLTNVEIELRPPEGAGRREAIGRCYLTAYRHDGTDESSVAALEGPVMVGDLEARFGYLDGRWRIVSMNTTAAFARSARTNVGAG